MNEKLSPVSQNKNIVSQDIHNSIVKIVGIQDQEEKNRSIDSFIKKRRSELNNCSEKYLSTGDSTSDYIDQSVILMPSKMSNQGYSFDDENIYHCLFDVLTKNKIDAEKIKPNFLYGAVFLAINNYFGENDKYTVEEQNRLREEIFLKNSDLDEEPPKIGSIKDFKDKNVSMCLEKAVFAHNCHLILGIKDTVYLAEGNILNSKEEPTVNHVFNKVQEGEREYLIDYSLAQAVYDEGRHGYFYQPQKLLISPDQKQDFDDKKLIFFDYKIKIISPGQPIKTESTGKILAYGKSILSK